MKARIVRFLNDLDTTLVSAAGEERLKLYHIGRSALVWKHGFEAATYDIDVVTPHGEERLMREALRAFGKDAPKALEHGLYLEEVPAGLPPVWGGCYMRATEADEKWRVIRLFHLDDHDLVVTKLKRFSRKDQEDIRQMCDFGLLEADTLEARVNGAWALSHEKDDDPERDAAFSSLRVVQKYLREGTWD